MLKVSSSASSQWLVFTFTSTATSTTSSAAAAAAADLELPALDGDAQLVPEALQHELLLLRLLREGHHRAGSLHAPSTPGPVQVVLHSARQAHLPNSYNSETRGNTCYRLIDEIKYSFLVFIRTKYEST